MFKMLLCVALVTGAVGCASLKPIEIAELPKAVEETSALIVIDSSIWTINDSQHSPTLFRLNKNGLVTDSVFNYQAVNMDWEELATDSFFVYIADIGNNLQVNRGFFIYTVEQNNLRSGYSVVGSQVLSFSALPDQPTVFPKAGRRNYDMEALFVKGGYAYIISKNVKACGKSYGKLYRRPNYAGHVNPELIDSFQFNEPITGATYDNVSNSLIVTGYLSCFMFDNFNENNFHNATPRRYRYDKLRQYEGITFSNDKQKIFLSNEKGFGKKSMLFEIPMSNLESDFGQHGGFGYAMRRLKLSLILKVYNGRIKRIAHYKHLDKPSVIPPSQGPNER